MTSAWAQVRALAALRWQMTRSTGIRMLLLAVPLAAIWLLHAILSSAAQLTPAALSAALALAPAAFLGFGFLAVIAPLTAGGGNELVPTAHLVAFPVRPRAQFLGGLLLAPANLVWVVQLLVVAAETAYLTVGSSRAAGAVTAAAYVTCLTVGGQALAWAVVGLRHSRTGRRVIGGLSTALVLTSVAVIRTGRAGGVVHAAPARTVVRAITAGSGPLWAWTTAALAAGSILSLGLGSRACSWALSRPLDVSGRSGTPRLRRRRPRRTALAELIAVNRASVWRAPALRRGGLVLAVLPGLVAIGAAVPWQSLVVLPGLVAAGAGLLFGINAFSLDGGGAVWLASLPHDPSLVARAKLRVLAETVVGAMTIAALAGSLRSPGRPSGAEVSAIVTSGAACGLLVLATCMALSVHRPHRAELTGPRDAVAPPGALTAASVRLSAPAGMLGLVLGAAASFDRWWLPLAVGTPPLGLAMLWLRRTMRAYQHPLARARVVQVVSAG